MKTTSLFALVLSALALVGSTSCGGPTVVRGSNDPSVDSHALSTGLDKDDIQRMLSESLNKLRTARIMETWRDHKGQDRVAIFPFQNETSQHIDSPLAAALSETETWLIEAGVVKVIARERQAQMVAEVEGHANAVFDQTKVARYGKQLGAQYFVTGKVQSTEERTDDVRRIQYWLFLQVIAVETSEIVFQHKAYVTKMIK